MDNNELEWKENKDYTIIPGTDQRVYNLQDPIVKSVIEKFAMRSKVGYIKYGMSMAENPAKLTDWLNSLQQELMDATHYIERILQELKNK